jgi:hypothetical protein
MLPPQYTSEVNPLRLSREACQRLPREAVSENFRGYQELKRRESTGKSKEKPIMTKTVTVDMKLLWKSFRKNRCGGKHIALLL